MKLFGDLLTISRDVPEGFKRIRDDKGDVADMRFGPLKAKLFSKADDVKTLLTAAEEHVSKSKYSKMLGYVFGDSIISASGGEWQKQHDYLIEYFQPGSNQHWTSVILSEARQWISTLEPGQTLLAENQSRKLIQRIIASLLFGDLVDPETSRESLGDLEKINDQLYGTFIRNSVLIGPLRHLPTPGKIKIQNAKKRFSNLVAQLFDKDIPDNHPSTAAKLIAKLGDGKAARKEIRDQLSILYFAGQDTTARSLAWTFLLLATHRDHIDLIRQEADQAILGDTIDRKSLIHTYNVIQESLRLFPPAYAIDRQVNTDGFLNPSIKQGTLTPVSVTNLHTDNRYWNSPGDFNPTRFNREQSANRPPCAYIPFGHGRRVCIGRPLALLELTIITALFCQHFDFSCTNSKTVKTKTAVTLGPNPDIEIFLAKPSG